MCEPYHSIVQYPDDFDDTGLPFEGQMDKESRLKAALGSAMGWARKFGKWFHFSRWGAGHSSAIALGGRASLYLPPDTRYEGNWWDRTFHIDGVSYTPNSEEAKRQAEKYHQISVFRDIRSFRLFLETSLNITDRFHLYLDPLRGIFTPQAMDHAMDLIRMINGKNYRLISNRPSTVKAILGVTRARSNFQTHFADDEKLWM